MDRILMFSGDGSRVQFLFCWILKQQRQAASSFHDHQIMEALTVSRWASMRSCLSWAQITVPGNVGSNPEPFGHVDQIRDYKGKTDEQYLCPRLQRQTPRAGPPQPWCSCWDTVTWPGEHHPHPSWIVGCVWFIDFIEFAQWFGEYRTRPAPSSFWLPWQILKEKTMDGFIQQNETSPFSPEPKATGMTSPNVGMRMRILCRSFCNDSRIWTFH